MVNLNIILTVIIISIILIILILLTLNYFNKIENFREINGKYGYICSYNTDCTPVENTMLCVKEGYNIYSCGDIKIEGLNNTRYVPSVVPIYNEIDISNMNITYIKATGISTRIFTDDGKLFITGRDYGIAGNKFREPLLSDFNIKKICDAGQDGISSSNSSIFFIGKDDNVYCYGYNGYGHLGLGDRIIRNTPTKIPPPAFDNKKIKDVYSVYYGRLFLTEDGEVYGCGLNSYKQLGGLTNGQYLSPELIPQSSFDNKKIKHINGGYYVSFFLTEDGEVYACGQNNNGQLGLGDTTNRTVPTLIPQSSFDNKKIKDVISSNTYTTIFLTEDGNVYGCGQNNYGELGLGDRNRTAPTLLNVSDIKQISSASQYTLFLNNDGILYSAGRSDNALGANAGDHVQECTTITKPVKQISSSYGNYHTFHSIILTEDGEVYTFGSNIYGQLGLGNINYHSGSKLESPLYVSTYNVPIIRDISTDSRTFLYVTSDGIAYGNGLNSYGQIGLGDKTNRVRPMPINYTLNYIYTLSNIKQVSCGHEHSAILTEDGFVYTCGKNNYGQLGTNEFLTNNVELNFMQIVRSDVKKVSCGINTLFILTNNGDVYACGQNNYGQLGLGDTTNRNVPTLIPNFSNIIDINTSSYYHTLFLTENEEVYACGLNNKGQLGIGNTTNMNTPTEVTSAFAIKKIFAGYLCSFFIDDAGDVYSCGDNSYGQLGLGDTTQKNVPDKVLLNNPTTTISCGQNFNVFIDDEGRTFSCGRGGYIGFADSTSRSTPSRISLNGVKEISSEATTTYFLKTNGTVYTYGTSSQPEEISGLSNVKTLAAGTSHSIIVKEDDSVHSIGYNVDGRLGLGDKTRRFEYNQVSVFKRMGEFNNIKKAKVGVTESLFLKEDGSVYVTIDRIPEPMISLIDIKIQDMCIGRYSTTYSSQSTKYFLTENGYVYSMGMNNLGQLGLGRSSTKTEPERIDYDISGNDFGNIKKISCGKSSCIFLKTDGSVYSTGTGATGLDSTVYYPTPIPFLSDIEDIEMSDSSGHALFLKKNGDVYGCGSNSYGQLGGTASIAPIKLNLMNIVSLSCGEYHSVFITKDGDAYACGSNSQGQLGLGDTVNRATPTLIGSISDVKKVHAESILSYLLKTAEA